jgi:hypothetical protein
MLIRDLTTHLAGENSVSQAVIVWEDHDFPEQTLTFTVERRGDGEASEKVDEPDADAFLTACFPLAAVHGETRVWIEGRPCPMLIDGLRTVHEWWATWGGMPTPAPEIETLPRCRGASFVAPQHAVACLSGGVDGLHMLMRNRQMYRKGDPAFIREALFIHGFDIGKRARDPENERYLMALRRLEPLAAEVGLKLIACRTNLRHLPTKPDFWTHRHNVAALASVGHFSTRGSTLFFIAGAYHLANPVPMGSHPAVDGLFSSQRMRVLHEGARFTRVDKVRELANWPSALTALRVCPANVGAELNCGVCEKCLGTRLELLVAGVEETATLGPSLTPPELWERAVPVPSGHRALRYLDLLPTLRARGLDSLCRVLEDRIDMYRQRLRDGMRWPGL